MGHEKKITYQVSQSTSINYDYCVYVRTVPHDDENVSQTEKEAGFYSLSRLCVLLCCCGCQKNVMSKRKNERTKKRNKQEEERRRRRIIPVMMMREPLFVGSG